MQFAFGSFRISHLVFVIILNEGFLNSCLMQFLEVGPELGNHYNEVIAPQDVATYGGLCALASFDRTELKATIAISNIPWIVVL